jgi:hypothetical protein
MLRRYNCSFGILLVISFFSIHALCAQNFHAEKEPKLHTLSLGIGPSFIYADNGGQYSIFDFAWNAALSAIYEKKLKSHISFRSTLGLQRIQSGGNPTIVLVERWLEQGAAVSFTGVAYYLDFMPVVNIFPAYHHMMRPDINLYAGLGFGALMSITTQRLSFEEEAEYKNGNLLTPTVPLRAGISYTINEFWDVGLEGGIIFTLSDKIDGNNVTHSTNDHLFQLQFVLKKYLNWK